MRRLRLALLAVVAVPLLPLFSPAALMSAPTPAAPSTARADWSTRGALVGERPRLFISTDIGGFDPDDFQSLVHLLLYADILDLEGLVSSPPGPGRAAHLHETLDAYAQDYPALLRHSSAYPAPDALRALVRQGALDAQPGDTPEPPSEAARLLIERAHAADPAGRPLYVLVWGSITDIAQAVHADPSIKARIRIYSIGSWNTEHGDQKSRDYLFRQHPDLWWIENDTTFRGMYMGGEQADDLGNKTFVEQHVRARGALGDLFFAKKPDIKMGDTPTVLYFLRGDFSDPASPHWGGAFVRPHADRPTYWHDDPAPELTEGTRKGARTVNIHRVAYLRDWQARQLRAVSAP